MLDQLPVFLFLNLDNLESSRVIDSLDIIGGQCSSLYPEKPIYDIPAYPKISGQELIDNLSQQIKPFNPKFILGERVEKIKNNGEGFLVSTSNKQLIDCKCIFIAAGNGAFGPNKPPIINIEEYENKSYSTILQTNLCLNKKSCTCRRWRFHAVDWAIELASITKKIFFIHRRDKLRAAPSNVEKVFSL